MNILSLDTATHTGWAVASGKIIDSGVEDFSILTKPTKTKPADHPGLRFAKFERWLLEKISLYKIDIIAYEMVVGGRNAGGNTSLIQKGLEALLLMRASIGRGGQPIPVWAFAAATIKKFATGDGRLTHESKIQMIDTARQEFADQTFVPHNPTKSQPWDWDDNQCDALWIAELARRCCVCRQAFEPEFDLFGSYAPNLTPLANLVIADKWTPKISKCHRR